MKVLFLVALAIAAVVAEPEAEAGAPNPYFGPPYQPNYYANPRAYNYGYYGYPHGYYGYPHHLLGKRSAEAEPEAEADPAVVYHGVTGVYGLGHFGHLGYAIAKPTMESAEAAEDATAKPTLVYPGVYGHGLYGHHLATVPTVVTAENRVHGAFVPQKVVVPGTVGHPVYPYAGLLGGSLLGVTHHAVKREAEAEPEADAAPEADAWYGHYYGHPYGGYYGYNGYPYRYGGYYGYGHSYWG